MIAPRKAAADGQGGSPRWLITFADLMALLVVFFVMLYSMSVIEVVRFQAATLSIRHALGPGIIEQAPTSPWETTEINEGAPPLPFFAHGLPLQQLLLEDLEEELGEEIGRGLLKVSEVNGQVVIRFEEKASFPSGSAALNEDFLPVLQRVGAVLGDYPGLIRVAGHTDDVPIVTAEFRSNWELSVARASEVVHVLKGIGVDRNRMVAQGHADTRPIVPNDTQASRAQNRRVDIILSDFEEVERTPDRRTGIIIDGPIPPPIFR